MTIDEISLENDGTLITPSGPTAETANPWTFRVSFFALEEVYNVGYFDTLAHWFTALAAAQSATQFGAGATLASLITWFTANATGFVAVRTYTGGGNIPDVVVE